MNKWIPLSKKRPKCNQNVLVYDIIDNIMFVATGHDTIYYNDVQEWDGFWNCDSGIGFCPESQWWQKLPRKPRSNNIASID